MRWFWLRAVSAFLHLVGIAAEQEAEAAKAARHRQPKKPALLRQQQRAEPWPGKKSGDAQESEAPPEEQNGLHAERDEQEGKEVQDTAG